MLKSEDMAEAGRTPASAEALSAVIAALSARFGRRLSTAHSVRLEHAHSITWVEPQPPDGVVFPHTTEEVAEIVRLCARHRVPVIPFGAGSSVEGHVNAPFGGITISMREMTGILAVHAEDLDCRVQAGVTRKTLNAYLRDTGLFFPIDPGADATLGGMASTRASGTNAVRYGTMKDNVLGLTVVLPDGEIATTGGRARKSSAGYDLTRLMIGAEGTLGIITELTLKLHGIPEAISGGVCPFPTVEAACNAVITTIQHGVPVARIELLDTLQVQACNAYSRLNLPECPTLFVEFHGSTTSVAEQAEAFGTIAADYDGGPFHWTMDPEERNRLWTARHNAHWAAAALRPGAKVISTDVCVPISRLADNVVETRKDLTQAGLLAPIVGHVGDGNFHVLVLVDMNNSDEIQSAERFLKRMVSRAIASGGTCTGEHGVGQAKRQYLEAEHGAPALNAMRRLKAALDPHLIMNPGKVV